MLLEEEGPDAYANCTEEAEHYSIKEPSANETIECPEPSMPCLIPLKIAYEVSFIISCLLIFVNFFIFFYIFSYYDA